MALDSKVLNECFAILASEEKNKIKLIRRKLTLYQFVDEDERETITDDEIDAINELNTTEVVLASLIKEFLENKEIDAAESATNKQILKNFFNKKEKYKILISLPFPELIEEICFSLMKAEKDNSLFCNLIRESTKQQTPAEPESPRRRSDSRASRSSFSYHEMESERSSDNNLEGICQNILVRAIKDGAALLAIDPETEENIGSFLLRRSKKKDSVDEKLWVTFQARDNFVRIPVALFSMPDKYGTNFVHHVVNSGNTNLLKAVRQRHDDKQWLAVISAPDADMKLLLHHAAQRGFKGAMEYLGHETLYPKADLKGRTPLALAIREDFVEVSKLLLNNGANKVEYAADEMHPLAIAVEYSHETLLELLLAKGFDVNQKIVIKDSKVTSKTFSLLEYACSLTPPNFSAIDIIIRNGALVKDSGGKYLEEYSNYRKKLDLYDQAKLNISEDQAIHKFQEIVASEDGKIIVTNSEIFPKLITGIEKLLGNDLLSQPKFSDDKQAIEVIKKLEGYNDSYHQRTIKFHIKRYCDLIEEAIERKCVGKVMPEINLEFLALQRAFSNSKCDFIDSDERLSQLDSKIKEERKLGNTPEKASAKSVVGVYQAKAT